MMLFALALASAAVTPVDAKLLADLPEVQATLTAHGKTTICTGPTLASVIAKLGQPTGKDVHGKALQTGIVATGRDGYAVLFSIGEIDPMLGASLAVIATKCDGVAISETDGPFRLVVPDEKRAARSVRQLESLTIKTAE